VPPIRPPKTLLSRRQFIQVGVAGAAILAAARWLDRSEAAAAPAPYRFLDARGAAATAALIPVIVTTLPTETAARARAIEETVSAFDRAVSGLSPAVRKEVDELFSILRFTPMRVMLTGLWAPLEESPQEEIAAFLTRWRFSSFDIQRAAYQALNQLLIAAWYGNAASWGAIGYPGAPAIK
jgi:hypothetical protein